MQIVEQKLKTIYHFFLNKYSKSVKFSSLFVSLDYR